MEEIEFKRDKVANVYKEIKPLLKRHFNEISANKDIDLDPNFFLYHKMEQRDSFVLFSARKAGVLIGYCAFFIEHNLHYQKSLQANQDVIFIDKEYRGSGFGKDFILYCDMELKKMGVQVVYQHVKVMHNFGPLLVHVGYKHVEHIYSKRLDE